MSTVRYPSSQPASFRRGKLPNSQQRSPGVMASVAEDLKKLRQILFDSLAIVILLAIAIIILAGSPRKVVVIENIQVPRQLIESGWSMSVVGSRLNDKIRMFQQDAYMPGFSGAQNFMTRPRVDEDLDIRVPGESFTFGDIVTFLSTLLPSEKSKKILNGEITLLSEDAAAQRGAIELEPPSRAPDASPASPNFKKPEYAFVEIVIREGQRRLVRTVKPIGELDYLLESAAEQLLIELEPKTMASYHYRTSNYTQTREAVSNILRSLSPQDKSWGYYILGLTFLKEMDHLAPEEETADYQLENAAGMFSASIRVSELSRTSFSLGYIGLAHVNARLQQPALARAYAVDALTMVDKDMQRNDTQLALVDLAVALDRPEDAIAYLETMEITNLGIDSLVKFGFALNRIGRHEEARVTFQRALEIRPKEACAKNGLDIAEVHINQGARLARVQELIVTGVIGKCPFPEHYIPILFG